MAGIFITTATGKALEDQISLMDKLTNEWTMRAARGECAWICSDCCVMFPDGMPEACAHGIQQCTSIITRDKMSACKQGAQAMTKIEENMTKIEENQIVQAAPHIETFGGCMVVVTEVKEWGIQGYVQSAGVPGQQYIRLKTGDFEATGGRAVWVAQ
jgi:hypothetical protein